MLLLYELEGETLGAAQVKTRCLVVKGRSDRRAPSITVAYHLITHYESSISVGRRYCMAALEIMRNNSQMPDS